MLHPSCCNNSEKHRLHEHRKPLQDDARLSAQQLKGWFRSPQSTQMKCPSSTGPCGIDEAVDGHARPTSQSASHKSLNSALTINSHTPKACTTYIKHKLSTIFAAESESALRSRTAPPQPHICDYYRSI